jgi:hypothetical protein
VNTFTVKIAVRFATAAMGVAIIATSKFNDRSV